MLLDMSKSSDVINLLLHAAWILTIKLYKLPLRNQAAHTHTLLNKMESSLLYLPKTNLN